MAHHLIPQPDDKRQESGASGRGPLAQTAQGRIHDEYSAKGFSQLRDRFASIKGGQLSAEISSDLALEILLNETIEQARLATGAAGASIVLQRDGEWVCRASSGANAPTLGERVHGDSGLIAECIRTSEVQRSDDCEVDSRVDIEACRALGIRSVIAMPLANDGMLLGVLMAVATEAFAFGREEQVVLESFAQVAIGRILQAAEPVKVSRRGGGPKSDLTDANLQTTGSAEGREEGRSGGRLIDEADTAAGHSPAIKVATWALAVLVFGLGGLLIAISGVRLAGKSLFRSSGSQANSAEGANVKESAKVAEVIPSSAKAIAPGKPAVSSTDAGSSVTGLNGSSKPDGVSKVDSATTSPASQSGIAGSSTQDGSLTVFENGREVFHLASGTDAAASPVIYRVEPRYPEQAKAEKVQGKVVLDLQINRDGSVKEVQLISGTPVLADAAIAAVKQWRFRPHLVKGQAVEAQTRISLDFKLPAGR